MRCEYALTLVRLSEKYPEFSTENVQLDSDDAVLLFVKAGMYDQAVSIAKAFNSDMALIFEHLPRKCLELTARSGYGKSV